MKNALALTADRVFVSPSAGILRRGVVVVEGDRILDVVSKAPASTPLRRYPGATLMAGLIDCHTHVSIVPSRGDQLGQLRRPLEEKLPLARANVRIDLMSGATTLRIMGEEHGVDFRLRDEIQSGGTVGPELLCAGVQVARAETHGCALTAVADGDDVEALVAANAAAGACLIKAFATGGLSSPDSATDAAPFSAVELRHIVMTAHRHGLPVAVHAVSGPGVDLAVEAGVHSIEHGADLTPAQIAVIRERRVPVVGTFSILYHPDGIERGDAGDPRIQAKLQQARLRVTACWRTIVATGIRVGLGTDSMHGCLAFEAARLVEFGASTQEALRALTIEGAAICGIGDRCGSLEPGKQADVIAVAGDPLEDIGCLSNPLMVMKRGVVVSAAAT